MMSYVFLIVQGTFLALYLWGTSRAARRTPGPPPWPLRLVMQDTGSPRMGFIYTMFCVSVVLLVVILARIPSHAQQQRQQLDRIEHLLREIRDGVQR
jgi:hypothetical protein